MKRTSHFKDEQRSSCCGSCLTFDFFDSENRENGSHPGRESIGSRPKKSSKRTVPGKKLHEGASFGSNSLMDTNFPSTREDTLQYDSDDSSLGSVGDLNEVNQDFFLEVPFSTNLEKVSERNSRSFHYKQQLPLLSHQNSETSSSTRRRYPGAFLKPRAIKDEGFAFI